MLGGMTWKRGACLLLTVACLFYPPLPTGEAQSNPYLIWIDIHQKTLILYKEQQEIKRWPVATGAWDTPTPIGVFLINSRFSGEMSGFGTCFLGLNVPWGQYGIHGTNRPESIGGNASHGCIRMYVKDAEELYAMVPNWTRVVLEGGPYGKLDTSLRPLKNGDRGSHVLAVQEKLRALGYYGGWPDGIYGAGTERAVRQARQALGLPDSGEVDWQFYQAIGLTLFE